MSGLLSHSKPIMEVVTISEFPIDEKKIITYKGRIGETEITVENILPQFKNDEERNKAKSEIMQLLYEVFSKYTEKC